MKVEMLKYPTEDDWMLCKQCALVTVSKRAVTPPESAWRRDMLLACHSPVRVLNFCFKLTDIPYWVSVHLARHVHATPFVSTQRNDRLGRYDRNEARQDAPITMCWFMNAEELMTIAHKRLCHLAAEETREIVRSICDLVIAKCPEFRDVLVPNCVYRGGRCDEFACCGYNKTIREEVVH